MQPHLIQNNPLLSKAAAFALAVMDYCDDLQERRKFVLSNQFLRSATSILANAMEAQNAESLADFLHKIKVAAKEADETQVWLYPLANGKNYPSTEMLYSQLNQIQRMLNSIVATSRNKLEAQKQNR